MSGSQRKTTSPHSAEGRWQRLVLALFALAFLTIGAIVGVLPDLNNSTRQFASGTLLKVGVVLGLAWLAAPQLERFGWQKLRGSLLVALIIVLVLWAIRPKIGAIAGGILIAGCVAFSLIGWFRKMTKPPAR